MSLPITDPQERLQVIAFLFDQYTDGARSIDSLMENSTTGEINRLLALASESIFDTQAYPLITHNSTEHLQ